jgi:hypothetical protein
LHRPVGLHVPCRVCHSTLCVLLQKALFPHCLMSQHVIIFSIGRFRIELARGVLYCRVCLA